MNKQKVFEGAIVYIQGYEFKVSDLRIDTVDGQDRVTFQADATDSAVNAGIKGSGYASTRYGGNDSVYEW